MPLTFNLDEVPDEEFTQDQPFIPTHSLIYVHHSHVRKIFHKLLAGQVNAVFTNKEGFGIKMEWKGDFLTFVPGVVNVDKPDETMWLSHASFWKREQHLREIEQNKRKQKQQEKVKNIDEESKKLLQKALDDEVI